MIFKAIFIYGIDVFGKSEIDWNKPISDEVVGSFCRFRILGQVFEVL